MSSAPRELDTRPAAKRRRGHRIYSGCNICRLRKIKCDKEQPSCANCLRSRRYICDGYRDSRDNDGGSNERRLSAPPPPQVAVTPRPSLARPEAAIYAPTSPTSQQSHQSQESPASQASPTIVFGGPPHHFAEGRRQDGGHDLRQAPQGFPSGLEHAMPDMDAVMSGPVHPLADRSPTLSESFAASLTTLAELEYGLGGVDDVLPWMLPVAHMPQMSNMAQIHGPAPEFPSYANESRHDTCQAFMGPAAAQALPLPPLPRFEGRDGQGNDTRPTHPAAAVTSHRRAEKQHDQNAPRPLSPVRHGEKPPQPSLLETQLPDIVQRLLHHYQTHVSQLMMPTSAPSHNPYLRLYLPMALHKPTTPSKECLLYAIVAVAAYNKAELSPVHDRDAYRQQALKYKEKADGMIRTGIAGCLHGGQQRLTESTDKQALLAAALTMTTVEVFSGANEGKGYEHILLCKQIIRLTGGLDWWMADTASLTLLQIFRCLEIIAYTSGWSCPPESKVLTPDVNVSEEVVEPSSLSTAANHDAGAADGETSRSTGGGGNNTGGGMGYPMASSMMPMAEYTLDVSFGVSMKTLHCLNKIIELAISNDGRSDKKKNSHVWPASAAQELRTLESDVFGIMADPDSFQVPPPAPPQTSQTGASARQAQQEDGGDDDDDGTSSDENDSGFAQDGIGIGISAIVSEEIKVNHMWAFHYSTALFFRRALCNGQRSFRTEGQMTPSSTTSLPSGQELVSKALEHLENVDALSSDIAIANTLWPGFIAAVEAVDMPLRHRALVWFARARRHGIGNIAKAKALVMEVWRRVDRQMAVGGAAGRKRKGTAQTELSRVDWRDVMREEGMYIMLT